MLERPRAGGVTVLSDPIHDYLAEIGRKGGAAGRGSAKARTSEQARAAVQARWARTKRKKRRKPSRHNPSVLLPHAPCGKEQRVVGSRDGDK